MARNGGNIVALVKPQFEAGKMEVDERMMLIRAAEERIGDAVTEGMVKCPCHLAIGQEAVAVGVAPAT